MEFNFWLGQDFRSLFLFSNAISTSREEEYRQCPNKNLTILRWSSPPRGDTFTMKIKLTIICQNNKISCKQYFEIHITTLKCI